eukprot:m.77265 g.77265  ORF g.77265 m.77265 type:complete len:85 (+) comp10596_c0_seq2:1606-1860(+)
MFRWLISSKLHTTSGPRSSQRQDVYLGGVNHQTTPVHSGSLTEPSTECAAQKFHFSDWKFRECPRAAASCKPGSTLVAFCPPKK